MPFISEQSPHDGASRWETVAGWLCSTLVMLILTASAFAKMSTPSPEVATAIARFGWEYILGSELFVVYTDERDTSMRGAPVLRNRAFVMKLSIG